MAGKASKGPAEKGDYAPSEMALEMERRGFRSDDGFSDDEEDDRGSDGGPSGANVEDEVEGEESEESEVSGYSQEFLDAPSGEGALKKRSRVQGYCECDLDSAESKKAAFDKAHIELLKEQNCKLMKAVVAARIDDTKENYHRIGRLKLRVKELTETVKYLERENGELNTRLAKYLVDPDASGDPKTLEYFLDAASVERLMDGIGQYNESEVKCRCFSCHFHDFGGAQAEEPVEGPCRLRVDFLKAAKHRGITVRNFLGDNEMMGDGLVKAIQTSKFMPGCSLERKVVTQYEMPEALGEAYREPGVGESYASYIESDNAWRIRGFGKQIMDCVNVNHEGIWAYRCLMMRYCSSDPVFYALCRLVWPRYTPKY